MRLQSFDAEVRRGSARRTDRALREGTLATEVARTQPLSGFQASSLQPLLEDEACHWRGELQWDYGEVSAAVASGLDRGSLMGRVLLVGERPVAYCYYLQDADRAIVGSLYASAEHRGQGFEEELLMAVLRV